MVVLRNTLLRRASKVLVLAAREWVGFHQPSCGCSQERPCAAVLALAGAIDAVAQEPPEWRWGGGRRKASRKGVS